MMENIRWGIIGCGDVTEVKSGPAFKKVPDSELIAVMRRDGEKARDYAIRHQVPKWYNDADALINDPDINAVYIATPPDSHESYAIRALKAGKPVYLEKPMSLDAESANRICRAATEAALPVVVAHYRRAQPMFQRIRELLYENAIGPVRFVKLQFTRPPLTKEYLGQPGRGWRVEPSISGGGLFHDLAPHQLDLMLFFFGEIEKAFGFGLNQGGYYKADDFVTGSILFKNQVAFEGHWCFTVPQQESADWVEIMGARGKIGFSVFNGQTIILEREGVSEKINFQKLEHVQQPMIARVVQHFLGRSANPCSCEQGCQVMRLLDIFTGK